jgi:hypothetical protein
VEYNLYVRDPPCSRFQPLELLILLTLFRPFSVNHHADSRLSPLSYYSADHSQLSQGLPLLIVVGRMRALWNHTLLQTDIIFMLPEDVCSLLKIISQAFDAILGFLIILWGRDSSVGIETRYELDGQGIESRWGRDFPHPSRPALGPTQPPVQWVPVHSRG